MYVLRGKGVVICGQTEWKFSCPQTAFPPLETKDAGPRTLRAVLKDDQKAAQDTEEAQFRAPKLKTKNDDRDLQPVEEAADWSVHRHRSPLK